MLVCFFVNIGPDSGMAPSGKKPSPEPQLTQFHDAM